MVIMLSFHLSKEGVSRVYFVKLGNKNCENIKGELLIWYKGLGMDNQFAFWKRCSKCCKKSLSFKRILFLLVYIGKELNCRSLWPYLISDNNQSSKVSTDHIWTLQLLPSRFVPSKFTDRWMGRWVDAGQHVIA